MTEIYRESVTQTDRMRERLSISAVSRKVCQQAAHNHIIKMYWRDIPY
jgi:hypothetical protein